MKSIADYTFLPVWGAALIEESVEVIDLWTVAGGLSESEAQRRIPELVFIVKHKSGRVAGVSTAVKTYVSQLNNYLFAYRSLILPEFRAPALDTQLIVRSKELLQEAARIEKENNCVGIIVIVQNEWIKQEWRQAKWSGADMLYIGNSPEGHHLRVGYFKGAKI